MNPSSRDEEIPTPVKFYWYREETEIYAAASFEEFRTRIAIEQAGCEAPVLTTETKDEEWGEANPETEIDCEDNGVMTLSQLIERGQHPLLPAQISTAYR